MSRQYRARCLPRLFPGHSSLVLLNMNDNKLVCSCVRLCVTSLRDRLYPLMVDVARGPLLVRWVAVMATSTLLVRTYSCTSEWFQTTCHRTECSPTLSTKQVNASVITRQTTKNVIPRHRHIQSTVHCGDARFSPLPILIMGKNILERMTSLLSLYTLHLMSSHKEPQHAGYN